MKLARLLAAFVGSLALWAVLAVPASAMTVSPPVIHLSLDPGEVRAEVLRLRNDELSPMEIRVDTANFSATPQDETLGLPTFSPPNDDRDGHGLARWIRVINDRLALAPEASGSVPFEIRVPADARPGSYFGAIKLAIGAPAEHGSVGARLDAAVLVLLRVNGPVQEDARLTEFRSEETLVSGLPLRFRMRVENRGEVHLCPVGEIVIRNAFGRETARVGVNRREFACILPGNARQFSAEWSASGWDRFAIGPYKAELLLEYGSGGKRLAETVSFWIVPWPALVMLFAACLVLWKILHFFARHRHAPPPNSTE